MAFPGFGNFVFDIDLSYLGLVILFTLVLGGLHRFGFCVGIVVFGVVGIRQKLVWNC